MIAVPVVRPHAPPVIVMVPSDCVMLLVGVMPVDGLYPALDMLATVTVVAVGLVMRYACAAV